MKRARPRGRGRNCCRPCSSATRSKNRKCRRPASVPAGVEPLKILSTCLRAAAAKAKSTVHRHHTDDNTPTRETMNAQSRCNMPLVPLHGCGLLACQSDAGYTLNLYACCTGRKAQFALGQFAVAQLATKNSRQGKNKKRLFAVFAVGGGSYYSKALKGADHRRRRADPSDPLKSVTKRRQGRPLGP